MICTVQLLLPRGSGWKPNRFVSPSRISSFDSSVVRLRLASKPGVRSRDWQQRSNQERTIPSRRNWKPVQANLQMSSGQSWTVGPTRLDCQTRVGRDIILELTG